MKKLIFLIIMFIGSLSMNAQAYDLTPKPFATEQEAIGTAKKTTETALYKGVEYPVYIGSRGGKFIVYLNSKGHWSKKYIPKS